MSNPYPSLLGAVDSLYRSVAAEPEAWSEQAFVDWTEETLADIDELDRPARSHLRRCLAAARRIQQFWTSSQAGFHSNETDWVARVDIAAGARAWRPTLELAMAGLAANPGEDTFAEVQQRFRLVHHEPYLGGATYTEWAASR